jgi:hypothetical protein
MVLEAKTDAPELALDGSTQAGFCKWFQSLPQVRCCGVCAVRAVACVDTQRSWLLATGHAACPCTPTVLHAPPSTHLHTRAHKQDPQVIRFFDRKGFHSVHGDAALFIARDFYRTMAVVKYLGAPAPPGTPGGGGGASSSGRQQPPATPANAQPSKPGGLPSVTLNRVLFESVLRSLLLEGGQHSVELWEGSGANWALTK